MKPCTTDCKQCSSGNSHFMLDFNIEETVYLLNILFKYEDECNPWDSEIHEDLLSRLENLGVAELELRTPYSSEYDVEYRSLGSATEQCDSNNFSYTRD